jgi:hypothetical protein
MRINELNLLHFFSGSTRPISTRLAGNQPLKKRQYLLPRGDNRKKYKTYIAKFQSQQFQCKIHTIPMLKPGKKKLNLV